MNMAAVLALAVGLSMDSFAASMGRGAATGQASRYNVIAIAALFGLCEATALAAGWAAGHTFSALITSVDHWIAFVLLLGVGIRMIHQGMVFEPTADPPARESPLQVIATTVATSIDAAAVGISLAIIDVSIVHAVAMVAVVTFVLTLGGASIGRSTAPSMGRWSEMAGGVAMICIGASILIQHLYF